jgi:hypothetical protein
MGYSQDLQQANGQDYSQAQQMPANGPVGMQYNLERHFVSNSPIINCMRQPDFDMGFELCMGQEQETYNVNFDAMGLETTHYQNSPNKLNGHSGRKGNLMGTNNIQIPNTIENELQCSDTSNKN